MLPMEKKATSLFHFLLIQNMSYYKKTKNKKKVERLKSVSSYYQEHLECVYVIVIIKNDLELQKANKLFNNLMDILEINIETIYFNNLNQCVRFFAFIAQKIRKFAPIENNKNDKNKNDKNKNHEYNDIDDQFDEYLNDNNSRIISILSSINDLNKDNVYQLLSQRNIDSLSSIQQIANSSMQDLNNKTALNQQQIRSVLSTFNKRNDT